MGVYHIALFKLKERADPAKIQQWQTLAQSMVGDVSGVLDLQSSAPLKYTADKAKGYDLAVCVTLSNVLALRRFAKHPSHTRLNELYKDVCDTGSTVAYDITFSGLPRMNASAGTSWTSLLLVLLVVLLVVDAFVSGQMPLVAIWRCLPGLVDQLKAGNGNFPQLQHLSMLSGADRKF